MLRYNKHCSLICSIFCLILIILLTTDCNVKAEDLQQNQELISAKLDIPLNNPVLSHVQTDSAKQNPPEKQDQNDENDEAKTEVEEEQDLMEKALDLLEMADNYWKNGDIENTLNTLDKAYALVLDTNGDVEIARQKDDLRLLISRRILALYSSQQSRTNGKASEIPQLMNEDVEKEIRSFQGPERDFFISSYHRSGQYREIIIDELRKAGVPDELFWLPLVESGFKVSALSRARALGLWQFIPSTGYKYGLSRDEWVDERMDIIKSTRAAIAYLKELHSMFGDWLTVLAAYNCGEGRVLRVISRQHINYFDRFWDLYSQLPNETARYVPRFLATLHIIRDPQKYGFDFQASMDSLINFETVKVNKMMKLSDVAKKMEVSEDIIDVLNAELRYKITPNREYDMKVPKESLEKFNLVYNDIPEAERPHFSYRRSGYVKHRIRSGETIYSIAKRYRVSTRSIYASNRINRKKGLIAGQVIRIPVDRVYNTNIKSRRAAGKKTASIEKTDGKLNTYKVRRGDSLLGIAKKFNVSVTKLKEINNLKTNMIKAGRVLKLPSQEVSDISDDHSDKEVSSTKSASAQNISGKMLSASDIKKLGTDKHIVTKGENLSIIARKYRMDLAKLIKMNNLTSQDSINPGQVLIVKK